VWLTEFGPHYDSLNECVIPTYPKRRSHKALRDFSALFCQTRCCCAAYFGGIFDATEGLSPIHSGAIMKLQ
jgi:hypothetical protein